MIMTSYFARYHGDNGVCIARFPPDGYEGVSYPLLFPPAKELHKFKYHIIPQKEFEEAYKRKVLAKLDPFQIVRDLDGKVMLCYEGEDDFCHRRLVADWIQNATGMYVPEFAESFCTHHGEADMNGVVCRLKGGICPYFKKDAGKCNAYQKPLTYDQMSLMDFLQ